MSTTFTKSSLERTNNNKNSINEYFIIYELCTHSERTIKVFGRKYIEKYMFETR